MRYSSKYKATNVSVDGAGRTQQAYGTAHRMFARGRLQPAEVALKRILARHPQSFDALLLLAEIRSQKYQLTLAKDLLRRAIALQPRSPLAHYRLGVAFGKQKRLKEAERCFRRALVLDPAFAEAELELGQALFMLGYLEDAAKCLRRALDLKPDLAQAHRRLGKVLGDQGQIVAAQDCYHRALALRPDYAAAYGNLAFTMNYDGEATLAGIYAAHRTWGALFPPPEKLDRTYANDRRPERRLRIGYVSGDFCDHAVSYFFEPLLASHDPSEVEVFCYSAVDEMEEDTITARLKSQAEHWSRIGRWDEKSVAERIRADRIDILVDLAGHTEGGRLQAFALKPAPVQATWLGYLNTTGLAAMDYRITDAIVDPEGEAEQFNHEALVRLRPPFLCYRPYDNSPRVSAPPALEAGYITFGSFNNLPKLSPAVIKLWARLLHVLPGSRFVIKTVQVRDPPTADLLYRRFAAEGIERDRIDLLKWRVRTEAHLARYELVDIAVDPFPFNGVTTTCEALWMGVPVVTLRGDRPYGRVGASLLASLGLPELVAEDSESYVETAARLGRDLSWLQGLRFSMRERMRASPLCDAPGFARAMEQAYRRMWRTWCAQAAPPEPREIHPSPPIWPASQEITGPIGH